MGVFKKRLTGYFLCSLGLALLAWPFSGLTKHKLESLDVNLFPAMVEASPHPGRCPGQPINPAPAFWQAFPEAAQTLARLAAKAGPQGQVLLSGSWTIDFAERLPGQDKKAHCLAFKGAVFKVERSLVRRKLLLSVLSLPRSAVAGLPSLPVDALPQHPALAARLVVAGAAHNLRGLPEREAGDNARLALARDWERIAARLGLSPAKALLLAGGQVVWVTAYPARLALASRPAWFGPARLGLGGALLLAGLWFMRGLYRRLPGINLAPVWAAVFGDAIFTLALAFPAVCVLEYLLQESLGLAPVFHEPAVAAVCGLGYLPAALFFALFASGQYNQSVEILEHGLLLHRPGGGPFLAWEDIRAIETKESRVVVTRLGIPTTRRLQTKLCFRTANGRECLPEAGLKSTKRNIIAALRRHAPGRLVVDVERAQADW